ncbi:MAG TPA: molybdate ABC transporter substrate-binding protein [Thermoleophilaceae bacterium]|jgi:molybdate transport system substrate-binding protein|nr:molybdate ABC transporter substrate-binding protein [Thermoleophilaceae bacterium]
MKSRLMVGVVLAPIALIAVGCGSSNSNATGSSAGTSSSGTPTLTVSAATSLTDAFTAYGKQFAAANTRFSFAGSDQLAAQIEQGAHPDVYAAANTKLPDQLFAKSLIEKPVVFATNTLVIAVPVGGSKITSIADLAKPGVKIAAGAPSVPVGSYTEKVLSGLPASERKAIEGNIVSREPDVGGVVGKVTEGAADAGFVYITDVKAASGKLKAIQIPASLDPTAAYGAAVVKATKHPKEAQDFVNGLLNGAGKQQLQAAGLGPPPR